MLMVKGDRQVKVGNATESKQFNRELTLPEFVDVKTLQSYLSENGQLTMEAPVLMDRVYNDSGSSTLTASSTFHQSSPGRVVDTTFNGGRQLSNLGIGNNQSSSYSSSFRQESTTTTSSNNNMASNSLHRNSPLRDQYSSTSSTSTLVNNSSNQSPVTFSTITSRPEFSNTDRIDGTKSVTYKFNLSEFAPEDIAIQVNDTMLKVSALRLERDGRGTSHREFKREIGSFIIFLFLSFN